MALAASQARLLFITMRQNDVEYQMEKISNDNVALAYKSSYISDEYDKMCNQTTYVDSDSVEISYDSMMANNNYNTSKIITVGNNASSNAGALVLTSSLASTYGISENSGTGSDFTNISGNNTNTAFIARVMGSDETTVAGLLETANTTQGAELTDTDKSLISAYINTAGSYPTTKKIVSISDLLSSMGSGKASSYGGDSKTNAFDGVTMTQIFNGLSCTDVEIAADGDRRGEPREQAATNITAVGNMMKDMILSALGYSSSSTASKKLTEYVTQLSKDAQDWSVGGNSYSTDTSDNGTSSEVAKTWATSTRGRSDNDHMSINAQSMLKRMLAIAISCMADDTSTYNSTSSLDDVTNNKDKMILCTVNSKGVSVSGWEEGLKEVVGDTKYANALAYCKGSSSSSSTLTESEQLQNQASYLNNIYNILSTKGWIIDDNVSETSYFNTQLQNSTYYVGGKSISSSSEYTSELSEAAKTAADNWKEKETAKIKAKEKENDVKLTQLQTEYSALTNDYESVKSIISSNVQRSFTYFQS